MAHAVVITRDQMEALLIPQGFQAISLPRTVELVYAKIVRNVDNQAYSLRVYTSINPDGISRAVGADAIRVNTWVKIKDQQQVEHILEVGGSKRVHRVEGWRNNLQDRIDHWVDCIGPRCPKCGQIMVEMVSGKGYRCATPGNRWVNNAWTICDGVVWHPKAQEPAKKQTKPRQKKIDYRAEAEALFIESQQI